MTRLCFPLIATAIILSGCAASINDTLNVTYSAPEGVTIERLAILPVTAGEGLQEFRRTTGDSLYNALLSIHPDADILPADDSRRRLSDSELAQRYANMVLAYDRTGILDTVVMREMARMLEVQHLLVLRVGYDESSRIGVGVVADVTQYRTRAIELFAHIWDSERGDIVWEASGGAAATSGEFVRGRDRWEILAAATWSLAERLPFEP